MNKNIVNIGLDFGTTSSSICYYNEINKKFTLLKKDRSSKIESKIYKYKNKFFTKYSKDFEVITYFKRLINNINFSLDNKYTQELEDITKFYLSFLKDIITKNFHFEDLIPGVFTVPTSYNHYHRSWYKNILEDLGFKVKRIISEPSAAAIAYNYFSNEKITGEKILVIDLGGGTTDISLLEKDDDFYQVIYNKGDLYLGGDDFSKELSKNLNLSIDDGELRKLENNIDDIKYYKNSLKKLEDLLITIKKDINEHLEDINDVILVGNGLKLIGVMNLLEDYFPKKLRPSDNQEYLVSYGAGILSHELENNNSELIIIDSTSLSLGIETIDLNFSIIIPSNSPLPASGVRKYLPSDEIDDKIELKIYQGEHSLADDNELVGELIIPSNPKIYIDSIYQVLLKLDLNGIIYVKIKDLSDKDYNYEKVLKFKKSDNIKDLLRSSKDNNNNREFRRLRYEINYMIRNILSNLEDSLIEREEIEEKEKSLNNLLEKCVDYISCVKYKDEIEKKYGHLQYHEKKDGLDSNNINEIKDDTYSDSLTKKYLKSKLEGYLDLELVINSEELRGMIENYILNFESLELEELYEKINDIDELLESRDDYSEFKDLILSIEYELESNSLELNDKQLSLLLERVNLEKIYFERCNDVNYNNRIEEFNKFCEEIIE